MFFKRDLGFVDVSGKGQPKAAPPRIGKFFERCLVFFGIILPVLSLLFENQFHLLASYYFDPFPSLAHSLLFALIPAANLLAWFSLCRNANSQLGLTLFANGMAFGVAILYSLMLMPVMSTAAWMILFLGFGLLAFSPSIALIVLWRAGMRVEKAASEYGTFFNPHQVHHGGHFLILAAVLAVELPSTFTRISLDMAAKGEEKGIQQLRSFGNLEVMLRACYERAGRPTDVIGSLYESSHPANVEDIRRIFYRVTGRTFNSYPIPEGARASMQHGGRLAYDGIDNGADDEFDADPDIAGEMVSGVSRGLTVAKSRLSARIDSDACVSQIDWYLDFNNKSKYDREVRSRIRLPHGAAINQASLIVNGKEHECDITLKEEARQIYVEAVENKQNPLLVSHCGEDTVLVQCYPVPPGKSLQLHLGIVSPLSLNEKQEAAMVLPQFEERNFQINVPHELELTANHELSAPWTGASSELKTELPALAVGPAATGTAAGGRVPEKPVFYNHRLACSIDGDKLAAGGAAVVLKRGNETKFWCKDEFRNKNKRFGPVYVEGYLRRRIQDVHPFVVEQLADLQLSCPKKLFVVLDCSASMSSNFASIVDALKQIPKHVEDISVNCATDMGFRDFVLRAKGIDNQTAFEELKLVYCVGGQTDGQALSGALGAAYAAHSASGSKAAAMHAGQPDCQVVWIHGAQPYDDLAVKQYLTNQMGSYFPLRLYDMQIASGPNQLLEGVNNPGVIKLARFSDPSSDLKLLFKQWEKPGMLKAFRLASSSFGVAASSFATTRGLGSSGKKVQQAALPSSSSGSTAVASVAVDSVDSEYVPEPGAVAASAPPSAPELAPARDENGAASSGCSLPPPQVAVSSVAAASAIECDIADAPAVEDCCVAEGSDEYADYVPGSNCPISTMEANNFDPLKVKSGARQTMTQLAQVFAKRRIDELCQAGDENRALQLAARYHLVTPVSSAVLMDTVSDLDSMSRPTPPVRRLDLAKSLRNSLGFGTICHQLNRLNGPDAPNAQYSYDGACEEGSRVAGGAYSGFESGVGVGGCAGGGSGSGSGGGGGGATTCLESEGYSANDGDDAGVACGVAGGAGDLDNSRNEYSAGSYMDRVGERSDQMNSDKYAAKPVAKGKAHVTARRSEKAAAFENAPGAKEAKLVAKDESSNIPVRGLLLNKKRESGNSGPMIMGAPMSAPPMPTAPAPSPMPMPMAENTMRTTPMPQTPSSEPATSSGDYNKNPRACEELKPGISGSMPGRCGTNGTQTDICGVNTAGTVLSNGNFFGNADGSLMPLNAYGEPDFLEFLKKFWLAFAGLFVAVFSLVQVTLRRMGVESNNTSLNLSGPLKK